MEHKAVVAKSGEVSNAGDFVKTTNEKVNNGHSYLLCYVLVLHQVELGVLLGCVHVVECNYDMCLVQKLKWQLTPGGELVRNDLDCPRLLLTQEIYGIPSLSIFKSVSIVHECTNSCVLVECAAQFDLEREQVEKTKLLYKHDFSNNRFCYNIFCTSNN